MLPWSCQCHFQLFFWICMPIRRPPLTPLQSTIPSTSFNGRPTHSSNNWYQNRDQFFSQKTTKTDQQCKLWNRNNTKFTGNVKTRRLLGLWTGQVVDCSSRGPVNSWTAQLMDDAGKWHYVLPINFFIIISNTNFSHTRQRNKIYRENIYLYSNYIQKHNS